MRTICASEWIARRPWCSGNIGTLGVSYHANCQWRVAKLQPPSLKAMIPWEGRADLYRDQTFHGGVFAMGFLANWIATNMAHQVMGKPRSYNPGAFNNNMLWQWATNNMDSEFWRARSADWSKTTVPFYSVGNWTGMGLHLRGNVEAFVNAASQHKKLRIHSGSHFHPFHSNEGRAEQLRWFDHWLKGIDTGIMDEPPVKLEIRTGGSKKPYAFRAENEWPIARTQWTNFHLDPDNMGLSVHENNSIKTITYDAMGDGVTFSTPPLENETEITGPSALKLFVSSSTADADLFVILRVFDPAGKEVLFQGALDPKAAPPTANGT